MVGEDKLEFYQGNTWLFDVSLNDNDIDTSYTAKFALRDDFDSSILIDIDSSITEYVDGSTYTYKTHFEIPYSDTNLSPGEYYYDVVVDNSTNRFTASQDILNVLKSNRYYKK